MSRRDPIAQMCQPDVVIHDEILRMIDEIRFCDRAVQP